MNGTRIACHERHRRQGGVSTGEGQEGWPSWQQDEGRANKQQAAGQGAQRRHGGRELESRRVHARQQVLEAHRQAALDSGADSATLLHCNHCSPVPHPIFRLIEYIIVPIFTIEYVARFSTYHAVNFLEIKVGRADQAAALVDDGMHHLTWPGGSGGPRPQ